VSDRKWPLPKIFENKKFPRRKTAVPRQLSGNRSIPRGMLDLQRPFTIIEFSLLKITQSAHESQIWSCDSVTRLFHAYPSRKSPILELGVQADSAFTIRIIVEN